MNCPKCGQEMQRVGLEQLLGNKVFVTLECKACHCRIEQPAKQGKQPL